MVITTIERCDIAGVFAPPPLIGLAVVLIGLALDWLLPAYVLTVLLSLAARLAIGLPLMIAGIVLAIAAKRSFDKVGTDPHPWHPTRALASIGPYAYVRNPMYVGLALLVAGLAVALASDWSLVMLVPAALVMHFGVVKREERYLEAKFGDDYRQYMARVPRYGIPG
jgi:protein-S-isoprenylcysteine O-methyltransferase Ste14